MTIKPSFKKLFLIILFYVLITAVSPLIAGLIFDSLFHIRMIEFVLYGALGGAISGLVIGIVVCNLALQFSHLEINNHVLSGPGQKGRQEYFNFSDVTDYRIDMNILGHHRIRAKDGKEILLPKIYFTKDQFENVVDIIKNVQQTQ